MKTAFIPRPLFWLLLFFSCKDHKPGPSPLLIKEMSLKKGELISCGPADQQLGVVSFRITGSEKSNEDFALGLKLLHSFEYDEAEKVFARIIDRQPECAMAYWGVAMSNFHPLWAPPSEAELKKGAKAIEIARAAEKTEKEAGYIEAIASFYSNWNQTDHRTRSLYFEKAMEKLYRKYPADMEAAIFYALALNAAAQPTDKTFAKQKKAGSILNALYPGEPNHPGIIHYIIHTYDYPELAEMALPAAKKYASVAPSSAHALHMPSHIFTRLGLWDDCIQSNLASVSSAQCYAQQSGIKGHWDEELHGLDYLMYAYLQKGDNEQAAKQWDYLKSIDKVSPANFKVAYAFAAMPSRYVLENRLWKEAAALSLPTTVFSWKNFPWQEAILHFARLMGAVHTNHTAGAEAELRILKDLHHRLSEQRDVYSAGQVEIQIKTSEAWIELQKGNKKEALKLMHLAAEMEDKTGKHPVTPGEVIPARELLGDMLMKTSQWKEALQAYERDLQKHPNRFNGLYGAGLAAERSGNPEKAGAYYRQLLKIVKTPSGRPEIIAAKQFLEKQEIL
jgi:tetratricopeptide (TPR) repeat protein